MRDGLIPILGKWYLDTNGSVASLNYGESEGAYWIGLDRLKTAPAILDAITGLAEKRWVTNQDLGEFVRSIDHLLHLRETVCGMGVGRELRDPELRALLTVERSPLPHEEELAVQRVRESQGPDKLGVDVFECGRVGEQIVAERHAAGRFALAPHAVEVLQRHSKESKKDGS